MFSRAVDILRLSCVFAVLQPDDGLSHYSTPGHILGSVCKSTPTFPAFYTIYPPFYPLSPSGYRPGIAERFSTLSTYLMMMSKIYLIKEGS